MSNANSQRIVGLGIMVVLALIVLVLDQASKVWVTSNMLSHDVRVLVEGFLRLRYTQNTGAAFGLFQGWTGALSIAAVAIIGAIVLSASRMGSGSRVFLLALGLVLGGALGNLVDRVRLGYVVDFIEVYGPYIKLENTIYTFPVFNVADSAITVGVLLIMLALLFGKGDEIQAGARPTAPPRHEEHRPSPLRSEE